MRLFTPALFAAVAVALLAGCSGNNLSTPNLSATGGAQVELQPGAQQVLDRITPDKHRNGVVGVYGSQYFAGKINGYKGGDPKNGPPVCSLTQSYAVDIAADSKGNLIDPDSGTNSVVVYKGPQLCGVTLATISNPYGTPTDAASLDAATGNIVVATFNAGSSIAVCSIKRGCYRDLKTPNVAVTGVALAKNGDCWASGSASTGTATLIYFKRCSGSGHAATGWKNTYTGGLDIDTEGNLVAIDAFTPQLWIYSGCNPTCTVVGGPFPLHGDSLFGHLNGTATEFVTGDYANGALDVYKYSIKGLTYEYSINNGLTAGDDVEGAAFDPGSRQ